MDGLGSRIKKLRGTQTQEELALLLNVDRTTLASWETDRREPDLEYLVKIADIANCSLDWLAGRHKAISLDEDRNYNTPEWYEVKRLALTNNVQPNKIKQLIDAALALKQA
jgi:transcriptional regulator with XRE-family HTH domain